MKAALYALHYIHSTHDYGISFTSDDVVPMHSYIHYPPPTDAEAYDDAIPPTLDRSDTILAYSNTCWGSQLGSAVADGTLLPLFKFCSMNGGIIFKNVDLSGGLVNAKIAHPSALAKLKFGQRVLPPRKLSTSATFPEVSPTAVSLFQTYPLPQFYTTTMLRASNGHTI